MNGAWMRTASSYAPCVRHAPKPVPASVCARHAVRNHPSRARAAVERSRGLRRPSNGQRFGYGAPRASNLATVP
jgi:hypothetical protein